MDLEVDLEIDLEGDLEEDFRGDFKQDLEGDLISSSGQVWSRSRSRSRSGPGLVQVWSRSGPGLVQVWSFWKGFVTNSSCNKFIHIIHLPKKVYVDCKGFIFDFCSPILKLVIGIGEEYYYSIYICT